MTKTDKHTLLAGHYLFRDVDPGVVERLGEMSVTRRLESGEQLFQKGDDGDALYGVLSGNVAIYIGSPTGREIILNVMEAGDMFGEIALLDGLPRTAHAKALEVSEIMQIRRRDFLPFLERQPKLAVHLLELLCERIRWTSDQIEDAAFLSLPARLAKRLLALATVYGEADAQGVRIGMKLSQSDLGQMLGTSRESVNRYLQDWAKQDWIALGRSRVTIRERQPLQELVDNDFRE